MIPLRERRAIGAALIAVFIGALDLTVIATILPEMVTGLRVNAADVDRYVWIVSSYLLAYIVAIPLFGRLSDVLGRGLAFWSALALFLVGSISCALANDLPTMVASRAIQGAGGGALLPITMALVADLLPVGQRIAALGLVGAVDTLGWVLGPIWGAILVGLAPGAEPWRWVFIINVPLALLAMLALRVLTPAAGRATPSQFDSDRNGISSNWLARLDLPGAVLLAIALLALNLGLSAGGELGGNPDGGRALGGSRNPLSEYVIPLLLVAAAALLLFVMRERRARWPLLPVKLFQSAQFCAAVAANFLIGGSLIVAMVDVPVITALIVPADQVSRDSALMLAPFTVVIAALSLAGGRIAARFGAKRTATTGLVLVAVGYALLWFGLRGGALTGMLPGLVVSGAGFGLVFAPVSATAIDSAPEQDRGIAAAMTLLFRLLGMTIGISILTAIAVRRLQGLVGDLNAIVQAPGESTAEFLARQTTLLYDTVLPLSLQVVRETFLLAAIIALVGIVPVTMFSPLRSPDRDT